MFHVCVPGSAGDVLGVASLTPVPPPPPLNEWMGQIDDSKHFQHVSKHDNENGKQGTIVTSFEDITLWVY